MARRAVGMLALGLVAVGALAGYGCSSDAATPSSTSEDAGTGDRAGPCYPNHTCNEGLTCIDDLCVHLDDDGGVTSSDAGTGSDAGGGGSGDAGVDASTCGVTLSVDESLGVQCPDKEQCGSGCCAGADVGSTTCSELACEPDQVTWTCDVPSQCPFPATQHCCADVRKRADACSNLFDVAVGKEARCLDECDVGQSQLCKTAGDCEGGQTCLPSKVYLAGNPTPIVVGVCVD